MPTFNRPISIVQKISVTSGSIWSGYSVFRAFWTLNLPGFRLTTLETTITLQSHCCRTDLAWKESSWLQSWPSSVSRPLAYERRCIAHAWLFQSPTGWRAWAVIQIAGSLWQAPWRLSCCSSGKEDMERAVLGRNLKARDRGASLSVWYCISIFVCCSFYHQYY